MSIGKYCVGLLKGLNPHAFPFSGTGMLETYWHAHFVITKGGSIYIVLASVEQRTRHALLMKL
jgi:hypothetical protein